MYYIHEFTCKTRTHMAPFAALDCHSSRVDVAFFLSVCFSSGLPTAKVLISVRAPGGGLTRIVGSIDDPPLSPRSPRPSRGTACGGGGGFASAKGSKSHTP